MPTLNLDVIYRDRGAQRGMRDLGDQTEKTGKRFGALKATAAAALAAVAVGAVKFGGASVRAYVEAETAQAKLQDAYRRFPRLANVQIASLERLNSTLATKTRFDDDATASGQAVLAQFKLTGTQIQQLTPLLQDYAARTGKTLPDAAKALGRSFLGNTRALKEVGINYKATGDTGRDFTNITRLLRQQVGGFAEREGKTAAGQSEILKNQWGELQETAGQRLLPALLGLGRGLLRIVTYVQDSNGVFGSFRRIASAAFSGFTESVGLGQASFRNFSQFLQENQSKIVQGFVVAGQIVIGFGKAITTMASVGLRGFAFLMDSQATLTQVFLGSARQIVRGAALAFGWIPGVGERIKQADRTFAAFTDGAVDGLRSAARGARTTADGIDRRLRPALTKAGQELDRVGRKEIVKAKTREDVARGKRVVDTYTATIKKVPKEASTRFQAPGVDDTRRKIQGVDRDINNLNSKSVNVRVGFTAGGQRVILKKGTLGGGLTLGGPSIGRPLSHSIRGASHDGGPSADEGGPHEDVNINSIVGSRPNVPRIASRIAQRGVGRIADAAPKYMDDGDMGAPGGRVGTQRVGAGWGPIQAAMRRHGARTFNTYPGHHPSMARARDVYPHNWAAANAARALSSVWYVIYRMKIASKNHGNVWRPYRPTNYRGDWRHVRHIHVARYDRGGLLASGGLAFNQSGSPERVLSPRQTRSFDRLTHAVTRGSAGNTYIVNMSLPNFVGDKKALRDTIVDLAKNGQLDVVRKVTR
jgi:hypothetical protein